MQTKICNRCGIAKDVSNFSYTKPTEKRPYGRYASNCKPCRVDYEREWASKNPERRKDRLRRSYVKHQNKIIEKSAARRSDLKSAAFDKYGWSCVCCGEKEVMFLTIDHIVPPGKKSDYEKKSLYSWLASQGYPDGFQTLCWNCNMAKGIYGKCPHHNC